MNQNISNGDLLRLLEKTGHFLYHRRGGKPGQGRILRLLASREEMTQKELQDSLEIQAGSMSEIIAKLECKGLITKEKKESDKRSVVLRITEEGLRLLEAREQERKRVEEETFVDLDEEEREDLQRILGKLLASWEKNYEKEFF